MANHNFSDDDIINHIGHRQPFVFSGTVRIDRAETIPESKARSFVGHESSLGQLGVLPLELLHLVLDHLDMQSLSRVSRVSMLGHSAVRSLRSYKTLVPELSPVLKALARSGAIQYHSASTLCKAMDTDRCASCGHFGAFSFVLSAERCCNACLMHNQSLWMLTLPEAKDVFSLTAAQTSELPHILSFRNTWHIDPVSSKTDTQIQMTSVRAAKEFAINLHGSEEEMEAFCLKCKHRGSADSAKLTHLRRAPLRPYSQDPLTVSQRDPGNRRIYASKCPGAGAVAFPAIIAGRMEDGVWCAGCYMAFSSASSVSRHWITGNWARVRSKMPRCHSPSDYIKGMSYRARSKRELVEHVHEDWCCALDMLDGGLIALW